MDLCAGAHPAGEQGVAATGNVQLKKLHCFQKVSLHIYLVSFKAMCFVNKRWCKEGVVLWVGGEVSS